MLDDHELMRRIEQQDDAALATLYDRYARVIYSLCFRILNNQTLAEEATQDTFMKIWNRAERWDANKGRLINWILTIARFAAIDRLRLEKRQNAPQITSIDDIAPIESETGRPEDPLRVTGQHLRHLMTKIPAEQAELIELAFFKGLTHRELAERLGIPLGTIKTRVRLGLQKLKVLWEETTDSKIDEES